MLPLPANSSVLADSLIDRLRAATPRIPVTTTLIAANLTVFLAMLTAGAGFWHSPNGIQLAWGANFGPATQDGEWWRLGTALFLHFGVVHLAMNLWALWDAGQFTERLYGPVRFTLIYFGAGLTGNLASLVMQGNRAVSGGASGAIFGVFGALMVALWFERQAIHRTEFRWLFWGAAGFATATLLLGLIIPGLDNSAHLGGWLSGMLLGVLLQPKAKRLQSTSAGIVLGLAVAGLIHAIPTPKYHWNDETKARQSINTFIANEARIDARWRQIIGEGKQSGMSFEQLAERIESDVTEPYEETFARLSRTPMAPELPSARAVEQLRNYAEKRRDASRLIAEGLRSRDPQKIRRGLDQASSARRDAWSAFPATSSPASKTQGSAAKQTP